MNDDVIYLDWDKSQIPKNDDDSLYQNRQRIVDVQTCENEEVTIFVVAFNNFEKTKNCVKYLLEHTKDVSHKLVLMDYGNDDDGKTLELFKSVEHPSKTVISINKNQGLTVAINYVTSTFNTKYYAFLPNDVYVTKNWLVSMLKCMKSDDRIGYVSSMSSNTNNFQNVELRFENLEEMQRAATIFNICNPNKWMEKRRIIPMVMLTSKEVSKLVSVDAGFQHNFFDDDFSVSVNRAGYKQIVCGDVFVHHDHLIVNRDTVTLQKSLDSGREIFKEKYFGLDAWDDFINYEQVLIQNGKYNKRFTENPNILGIDVKTGIPLYEVKNKLRENKCAYESELYAFTTDAKYYFDLQNVCNGKVKCDRIEFITDHYPNDSFDYIVLGEYINKYANPFKLVETIINVLAPQGHALIKMKNTMDVRTLLSMAGFTQNFHQEVYTHLYIKDLMSFIETVAPVETRLITTDIALDDGTKKLIQKGLAALSQDNKKTQNTYVEDYYIYITKK